MNVSTEGLPGLSGARNAATRAAVAIAALLLGACSGGADTTAGGPDPLASCDPGNPGTVAECGSVIVSFTDADGDFLNYTVDVLSLTLETANGRIVETLPRETRINFTDYVDLTELVTVATVPPATYVAGTIRFDYSDAEVFVAVGDGSKAAVVTDQDGTPLSQAELRIRLSNRDQLTVRRGLTSLLQLDFDLAASHVVDIVPTPATATAEPFIVAEVTPVDEKTMRVRGPLVAVDEAAGEYIVALRPFHHRDGDFGRVPVKTTEDTEFEINGEAYFGAAGLQALAAAGRGTPTVAGGTLSVAEREFTAAIVLAGSSVPGAGRDAVVGNVIARDGDILTVRGATIIPHDRRAHFHDDVLVQLGPDTRVFRDGDRQTDLGIGAISVGQRVTIRGSGPDAMPAATDASSPQILFDATAGGHLRFQRHRPLARARRGSRELRDRDRGAGAHRSLGGQTDRRARLPRGLRRGTAGFQRPHGHRLHRRAQCARHRLGFDGHDRPVPEPGHRRPGPGQPEPRHRRAALHQAGHGTDRPDGARIRHDDRAAGLRAHPVRHQDRRQPAAVLGFRGFRR
jgi:hypothetical protein